MTNHKQFGILIALALGAGFVGGVVGSLFFSGEMVFAEKTSKPKKVVRAEKFELVDEKGKIRGEFRISRGNYLEQGGTKPEYTGPGLNLFDEDGRLRSQVYLNKGGTPSLTFYDETGKIRINQYVLDTGKPHLNFHEDKTFLGIGLASDSDPEFDGTPSISFGGPNEHLSLLPNQIIIVKKNGSERVSLGFLKHGEAGPFLIFTDNNLKRRVEIGRVSRNLPISTITMFDEKGNKIWSAP